jgi:hypothetical protein
LLVAADDPLAAVQLLLVVFVGLREGEDGELCLRGILQELLRMGLLPMQFFLPFLTLAFPLLQTHFLLLQLAPQAVYLLVQFSHLVQCFFLVVRRVLQVVAV